MASHCALWPGKAKRGNAKQGVSSETVPLRGPVARRWCFGPDEQPIQTAMPRNAMFCKAECGLARLCVAMQSKGIMKLRCPICHSSNSIEAYTSDADGRELLILLAKSGPLFGPLASYLGCFRPATRDLAHNRALRLAQEVLALDIEPRILVMALGETVEALRRKRDQGTFKPLKDHRYLQSVIETVSSNVVVSPPPDRASRAATAPPTGKRARAIADLAAWGAGDWLRGRIADGLAALVALGLEGAPGADVITRTADVWHHVMAGSCGIEAVDSQRVKAAFSGLIKAVDKWPEPKAIWTHMPRRPQQPRLEEPPEDADQRRQGAELARKLARKFGEGL